MPLSDAICQQLRARGRRVTPQRRAIIRALQEDDPHPDAEQIFARVSRVMPDLSPATVYNTLRELVEIGVLTELDLGLGERHYDLTTDAHAHLVCLACGRVVDVPYDHEGLVLSAKNGHGFQIVDCQVMLRGYCPACARQRGNQDASRIS